MQETRVLVETSGTTGEETTSYWFDLPIDVSEFEEKLGVGAESGDYRIIEKVLPFADEVHEHTSVYQLNELDFMYRQLSSDMQEEYVSLLTVFENLEALYICRNVITVYHDCKSMIDVTRQKLMNDPTFKHLSEDCQEYYFDFEAYARMVVDSKVNTLHHAPVYECVHEEVIPASLLCQQVTFKLSATTPL